VNLTKKICVYCCAASDGASAANIFAAAPVGEHTAGFGEDHRERA